MTEPSLKEHWKDLGVRIKYHGKCTFDAGVFADGLCYECMFYVDGGCHYLIEDSAYASTQKMTREVKE